MIKALAITGPTASGKTALSIEIAREIGCEIISCDSMQIYKGMDIGTAKATKEEQSAIPHHLIDFLSPTENYSAESYREAALSVVEELKNKGKTPLFVGGTGLYINSVMRGGELTTPGSSTEYREKILANIKTDEEKIALWQRLYQIDRESAEKTHYNNLKRVIRALEIYDTTGIPKSVLDKQTATPSSELCVGMITLDFHNRDLLYSRVDRRVDVMMEEGLLSEVESLYNKGLLREGSTAAQAIGYKELVLYIKGQCSLTYAIQQIKQSSRRYAKRQLTWFRHNGDGYHLFVDREEGGMRDISEIISEAKKYVTEFMEN